VVTVALAAAAVLGAAAIVALGGCGGSSGQGAASATGHVAGTAASGGVGSAKGARSARRARSAKGARSANGAGSAKGHRAGGDAGAAAAPATGGGGASAATPAAGGGASAGGAQPPQTFSAAADAICRGYRHQVSGLTGATTLTAQERVFPKLLAAVHGAVGQLERLSPPANGGGAFKRLVELTKAAVADFVRAQARTRSTREASGVVVESQDFAAFKAAGKAASGAAAAARRLHLNVCGSPGSDWL
jgi:hypothetical protein